MRSRLYRRKIAQTKKSLLLFFIGSLVIIFVLLKFGLPLLANVSYTLSGPKAGEEITNKNTSQYLAPPILISNFSATNSASISISGTAQNQQTVILYVNDQVADKKIVQDGNSFTFEKVEIQPNENTIKAKILEPDGKQSDFSNILKISFLKSPPQLNIEKPSDNQSFSKEDKVIAVSGKTDPGAKITINNYRVVVDGAGNFIYDLTLKEGENLIKITASDEAGNKTEAERKVNYSP